MAGCDDVSATGGGVGLYPSGKHENDAADNGQDEYIASVVNRCWHGNLQVTQGKHLGRIVTGVRQFRMRLAFKYTVPSTHLLCTLH